MSLKLSLTRAPELAQGVLNYGSAMNLVFMLSR